jgi:hypothetical protein
VIFVIEIPFIDCDDFGALTASLGVLLVVRDIWKTKTSVQMMDFRPMARFLLSLSRRPEEHGVD